ncbi:hypothetical protein Tco_0836434, partial [Tanacetum coccineum]
ETQKPLLKDEDGEEVDVHMYRSMIGSLMYLTSSRPDIMFVVCACARYQVNPKVSHLHAVKRIFRYLKGQPKLGLWYLKDSPFNLVAYTDSDYARASLDKNSTTGGSGPRRQETMGDTIAQTRSENVSKLSNDPLLARGITLRSGEDSLKLQGMMGILCYNFTNLRTDEDMFGVNDLDGDECATNFKTYNNSITDVEMTLAQALAELKSAKPKATTITTTPTLTTTAAITITAVSTRPKAKGIVIRKHEQVPTPTVSSQQPSYVKVQDKGKGKMVEPEPVKKMSKKETTKA